MRWRSSASRPARPPAPRRSCTATPGCSVPPPRTHACWHLGPARRHPGLPADGLGLRPGDDVDGRAADRRPRRRAGPGRARGDARGDGRPRRHLLRRRDHDVRQAGPAPRHPWWAAPGPVTAAPVHLRRRAAERGRLLALAAADRLPGARRLRRVRVLPGRHLRPLRGSAAAAGQRRPGRGRGRPAAGRPGGPGRAARRHRRGVDPRPGPPGRLLARPRPHGAGPDAGRLVPDRRPRPGRRRGLRARRRAGLDHDHPRRQQRLAGRGRGRAPGPSRRPGGGRGRAAGRASTARRSRPRWCSSPRPCSTRPRCGPTAPAVLAGYKVPSRVVEVEQLPRNPHTGKVQRTDVVALLLAPAGAEVEP